MKDTTKHANGLDYTDDYHAEFATAVATAAWIEGVAAVPIDEVPLMIAEDPAVLSMLVGALRHARTRQADIDAAMRLAREHLSIKVADPDFPDSLLEMLARAVLALHEQVQHPFKLIEAMGFRVDETEIRIGTRLARENVDLRSALTEALHMLERVRRAAEFLNLPTDPERYKPWKLDYERDTARITELRKLVPDV